VLPRQGTYRNVGWCEVIRTIADFGLNSTDVVAIGCVCHTCRPPGRWSRLTARACLLCSGLTYAEFTRRHLRLPEVPLRRRQQ
jgi:hypothetical protein